MKKVLLSGILMAIFSMPVHAQFLKKLQQKVEKKVEDVVTTKVADKAAMEAGKSMDKLLDVSFENSGFDLGFEQVEHSEIPDSYDFEWQYVMHMETSQGDMDMTYLLKKDAPYFGFRLPDNDLFVVMDPSNEMTVMFMEAEENKMITATKLPEPTAEDLEEANSYNEEFEFEKIGNKTILGYNCTGYRAENEESVFTFYITGEPEISFNDIYKSDQTKLPKGFDPEWLEDGNALMMEMTMENKKDPGENVSMTCTALERKPFTLYKNDYQGMAGLGE